MTSLLVVDDDDAFRTTIGRDLAEHGYDVRLASNADEAMGLLARNTIDILLTDLRMPGADGIDLLVEVRALSRRTRTILMSGYASARDYQRAIEVGAVRVLCKPFTSSELLQAIRQAIDSETGFRGSIHGLSIVDLLQMYHYARRSLAIVVDGYAVGHVFLEDGRIVHATHRELTGEEALRAILATPAGSLRTMVLPEGTPHTIARDFEGLLLDSLRANDELAVKGDVSGTWNLDALDDAPPPSTRPPMQIFVDRLRKIDGYATSCLVDSSSGVILGADGHADGIDLQAAVAGYSELYRAKRAAVAQFAFDDAIQDIVISFTTQIHVLHALGHEPECFLFVILERRGNMMLVTRALAAAEASLDA
ncbi:MAG TPA: response regulator [Kofleriaceae bacterium]